MAQSKGQNVGTPRFFLDVMQYNLTIGEIDPQEFGLNHIDGSEDDRLWGLDRKELASLFYLNPTTRTEIIDTTSGDPIYLAFPILSGDYSGITKIDYCMFLGHNLKNSQMIPSFNGVDFSQDIYNASEIRKKGKINGMGVPEYNGWSYYDLFVGDSSQYMEISLTKEDASADNTRINCISIGTKYDMPHSPDLQLTMTREFDGISQTTTKGGALLSNINYAHSAQWLREPWGLNSADSLKDSFDRRPGRRVWNLKFSYIDHSDIMPDNEMFNNEEIHDTTDYERMHQDDTFFSQFMRLTLGGNLKFIFQPDKDNNKPDGFAICILDQKGISIKQVAHQVYDISLKIMEVW